MGDELGRVLPLRGLARRDRADQVVADMFDGWRHQQLARNLSLTTIESRARLVTRFLEHSNEMPWAWSPAHVDDSSATYAANTTSRARRSGPTRTRSSCSATTSSTPATTGTPSANRRSALTRSRSSTSGTPPDTTRTTSRTRPSGPSPGRSCKPSSTTPTTRSTASASLGRKGWLPAFRDATLFKTAYGWGLRRNEVRHLQTVDFSRNPHAKEFGRFGALAVRHGKAHAGSAPKRRTVLTVRPWSAQIVEHWIGHGLPLFAGPDEPAGLDSFPTERGTLVSEGALGARFRRYRDELGLSPGLDLHSFRRSYTTHLLEDGVDAMFVQHQLGHEHASTTAIYTHVSSDYRTRTLRHALDTILNEALGADRPTDGATDGTTDGATDNKDVGGPGQAGSR